MPLLLDIIQDPTDIVIQSEAILLIVIGSKPAAWDWNPVINPLNLGAVAEPTIPRTAMQLAIANAYVKAGPMATATGDVVVWPLTLDSPPSQAVDPVQIFLGNGPTFDGVQLPSIPEPAQPESMTPVSSALTAELLPQRDEIVCSGLFRNIALSNITIKNGFAQPDDVMACQEFELIGVTLDGRGAPLGGCAVTAEQTGLQYAGGQPIIAETISDGSGNFSINLRNIDYQLTAYKQGSSDQAGITKNTVTPVTAQTIYLRDPTVADNGFRPIGSPVVRRIEF